ncbi:hypothetical protein B0T18DRAFT_148400 [Schizothecium vesticola]|uniref:Uncharacterized protein n=1 Tax=Schizothecium vesticola TaxID=314040 RepID=A0AA40EVY7_9PEZI|nr:hypothetical protein B0T18DRAFT_148400 [Schizothecium vesticola]
MWASIVRHSVAARLVKTLPFDSAVHARAETADRLPVGKCGDTIGRSHRDPHVGHRRIVRCGLLAQRDIWSVLHGLHHVCACIREGGDSHLERCFSWADDRVLGTTEARMEILEASLLRKRRRCCCSRRHPISWTLSVVVARWLEQLMSAGYEGARTAPGTERCGYGLPQVSTPSLLRRLVGNGWRYFILTTPRPFLHACPEAP